MNSNFFQWQMLSFSCTQKHTQTHTLALQQKGHGTLAQSPVNPHRTGVWQTSFDTLSEYRFHFTAFKTLQTQSLSEYKIFSDLMCSLSTVYILLTFLYFIK